MNHGSGLGIFFSELNGRPKGPVYYSIRRNRYSGLYGVYELQSKLLVCPLITPVVVPYISPYISPFQEFRL